LDFDLDSIRGIHRAIGVDSYGDIVHTVLKPIGLGDGKRIGRSLTCRIAEICVRRGGILAACVRGAQGGFVRRG